MMVNCPKCGKPLARLLVKEEDTNLITKSLTSIMFCVNCEKLFRLDPVEIDVSSLVEVKNDGKD